MTAKQLTGMRTSLLLAAGIAAVAGVAALGLHNTEVAEGSAPTADIPAMDERRAIKPLVKVSEPA